MNKKMFYSVIAILIIVLLLVCSWKFVLGIVVALAVVYFFGEEKVKTFLLNLFNQTKETLNEAHNEFKKEEIKTKIDGVSMAATKQNGWYQIVIVADGKSWLLKPSENSMIPGVLKVGAEITIRTTRTLTTKGFETKTVVIADDETFEVAE